MRKRKGLLGLYQFVERSLLIPEVRGSALVIGKIYIEHLFVYLLIIKFIEKTKINKKRPGIAHFFKKHSLKVLWHSWCFRHHRSPVWIKPFLIITGILTISQPLFHLCGLFKLNASICTTKFLNNYPSSVREWDSNSQPLAHESPPRTTRTNASPL